MIAPKNITTPLVRKVKFYATKFEWLGSAAARSGALWFWHTAGVKSLDDVKKREIPIATSGFDSSSSVLPRLVNKYLWTKLNIIYGYRGGGLMNLAIEKGEVMGRVTFHSAFAAMLADPTFKKQAIKRGLDILQSRQQKFVERSNLVSPMRHLQS